MPATGQLPFGSDAEISRSDSCRRATTRLRRSMVALPFVDEGIGDGSANVYAALRGLLTWPPAAGAQKTATPVIGFLQCVCRTVGFVRCRVPQGPERNWLRRGPESSDRIPLGGQYDRLPALAADLVRRKVAILVATGPDSALAAKAATAVIPIVFTLGPILSRLAFVSSLGHPEAMRRVSALSLSNWSRNALRSCMNWFPGHGNRLHQIQMA
jgi:hypothetical protein